VCLILRRGVRRRRDERPRVAAHQRLDLVERGLFRQPLLGHELAQRLR
jgi:hypothetical protein